MYAQKIKIAKANDDIKTNEGYLHFEDYYRLNQLELITNNAAQNDELMDYVIQHNKINEVLKQLKKSKKCTRY